MSKNKICLRCLVEKAITEFYIRKKNKSGLYSYCKTCEKARISKWNADNRERSNRSIHLRKRPYLAYRKTFCERCGFIAEHECQLDVDHIDDNHKNDAPVNLMTLCANCHRLKSRAYWMKDVRKKEEWLRKTGFLS